MAKKRTLFISFHYWDALDKQWLFSYEFLSKDKLKELEVSTIREFEDLALIEEHLNKYKNVERAAIVHWRWV